MIPVSAYAQRVGLSDPGFGVGVVSGQAGATVPGMASNISLLAPKSEIYFHPQIQPRHDEKQSPWYSWMAGNFNLNSFFTFLPMLRAFGYSFDIMYGPITGWFEDNHLQAVDKKLRMEKLTPVERFTIYTYGDKKPPLGEGSEYQRVRRGKAYYQHVIDKVEGVTFTAFSIVACYSMLNTLLKDTRLALAAELSKEPEQITLFDLRKSNNPMIATEVDKAIWKTIIRMGSGLLFFKGLQYGVLGNVLSITGERTVFYNPTAYDILQKSINNVQINNLGMEAKPDLVDALVKCIQAQRIDHRREVYSRDKIDSIRPVLDKIAESLINKQYGVAGALYIMGGGIIIPGDLKQSMVNYEHVEQVGGVKGIAKEGAWIRRHNNVPTNKVWDARMDMERKGENYVAESAQRDALLEQRAQILAKGPSLPGVGRKPDGTAPIVVL